MDTKEPLCDRIGPSTAAELFSWKAQKIAAWKAVFSINWVAMPYSPTTTIAALAIRDCHIAKAGASGICFVGDPNAARNPLFHYDQVNKLEEIDRRPGPKTSNYPAECLVENCLIYLTGRVEKQTAGILIDLAESITIRHCSIYDMPRAGINIGDGCWGGHVIEFCDIFDTVKEPGTTAHSTHGAAIVIGAREFPKSMIGFARFPTFPVSTLRSRPRSGTIAGVAITVGTSI
jgi:hypothetical protein